MPTITVVNNNNAGAGSLRQAIIDSVNGDTINFAGTVVSPIILTTGVLLVNKNITISGPGARILTVNGNNASGVFEIPTTNTVTITGLTITNGNASNGGGIFSTGNVKITYCTINANTATSLGGGIDIQGIGLIHHTTISNNTSGNNGGGINISGGATTVITMYDCTISGNTATSSSGMGGGIKITNNNTTLTMTNCTVSNNTAKNGGGSDVNAGDLFAGNTIIAQNTATVGGNDITGNMASSYHTNGNNFIGDKGAVTAFVNGVNGDQVGTTATPINAMLGALTNNGGPTDTMLQVLGSPVIDKGNNALLTPLGPLTTDQRNYNRIFNLIVDIGAVEFGSSPVCYSGNSLAYVRNKLTGETSEIPVRNVFSDVHEVYDVDKKEFIPVRLNIRSGPTQRYMLIKKGALGDNMPKEDFYITSGHKIVQNGVEIKSGKLKEAKRVRVKSQIVYSICTDLRSHILINGIPVVSYGYEEWLDYAQRNCISWDDNK